MPTTPQPNRAFAWTQAPWGPVLQCSLLGEVAVHLFTIGNLDLRNERREWSDLAHAMGVDERRLRLIRQVHGAAVAVVRRGSAHAWNPPEADVIVSDDPAAAIAVRVADCAPILLADRRVPVVGAVHAGWRGTLRRAAQAGVAALQKEFGSDPKHLVAAIGPCLGPCCGEVGEEVLTAFRDAGHSPDDLNRWFRPGSSGRSFLDLWTANRDQLLNAGVPGDQVFTAELCTQSHTPLLHSYRVAKEKAGRMVGVIRPREAR
jgi:YfiH family protein